MTGRKDDAPMAGAIDQYLSDPQRFTVTDARDPYERLGILGNDVERERWRAARVRNLAASPGLVDAGADGLAATRSLDADSEAFGIPIGAIDAIVVPGGSPSDEGERAGRVLEAVRAHVGDRVVLLTALVDLDRPVFLEELQRVGARVYAVNHTWTCPTADFDPAFLPGFPEFREDRVDSNNAAELLEAVGAAYSTYRSHYDADGRLEHADVAASYVRTVADHVASGGDVALVRSADGTLVAFETIDPHTQLNDAIGRPAVGELAIGGVVPGARLRGAYETSLAYGVSRFRANGYSDIVFACTADNFAVQSTWIRIGRFRPRRVTIRLHWWLDS